MIASASRLGLEVLPAPEPDEIVIVFLEERKVGIEVGRLRSFTTVCPWAHAIMEVVPDVRAGQIDCPLFRFRGNGEITRIHPGDH